MFRYGGRTASPALTSAGQYCDPGSTERRTVALKNLGPMERGYGCGESGESLLTCQASLYR